MEFTIMDKKTLRYEINRMLLVLHILPVTLLTITIALNLAL